ncbi:LOW QUALITY PROTEIN: cysteine protease ATG4D [Agelaius tricolor]|uniref:LOW QUALITY PROTEIN: cysteine protease ATG4D n=1 Tax=Agelaius tricolor TaxID=9191 RepID=UPI0039F221FB
MSGGGEGPGPPPAPAPGPGPPPGTERGGQRVRGRVLAAWNSVKYGWTLRPRPHFSPRDPLYLLGRVYAPGNGDWMWPEALLEPEPGGPRRTREAPGRARPPRDGPRVPRDGHGTPRLDPETSGRTRDHLGRTQEPPGPTRAPRNGQGPPRMDTERPRGTREPPGQPREPREAERRHRAIVSWLSDHPRAPFGIHRLVELGREFGKSAGDWFGPAIAAHLLRGAVESCTETPGLAVYVAQDCTGWCGASLTGGTAGAPGAPGLGTPGAPGHGTPGAPGAPEAGQPRGLILLVPARLGGENLNPVYVECVKALLQLRSCLGIIGGKPRHSLFFLGFQGDSLLYLDPHLCQPCVDTARENFPLQSFHCGFPRKMPFGKMDPSCTLGFYARGAELEQLWGDLARVLAPPSAPERSYHHFHPGRGPRSGPGPGRPPPGRPPPPPGGGNAPKNPKIPTRRSSFCCDPPEPPQNTGWAPPPPQIGAGLGHYCPPPNHTLRDPPQIPGTPPQIPGTPHSLSEAAQGGGGGVYLLLHSGPPPATPPPPQIKNLNRARPPRPVPGLFWGHFRCFLGGSGAFLGHFWFFWGSSGAFLGHFCCFLGGSGAFLGHFRCFLGVSGASPF